MEEKITYRTFNLKTKVASKKSWKTYKGAMNNTTEFDIVSDIDGINWAIRHPEWCEERLKAWGYIED